MDWIEWHFAKELTIAREMVGKYRNCSFLGLWGSGQELLHTLLAGQFTDRTVVGVELPDDPAEISSAFTHSLPPFQSVVDKRNLETILTSLLADTSLPPILFIVSRAEILLLSKPAVFGVFERLKKRFPNRFSMIFIGNPHIRDNVNRNWRVLRGGLFYIPNFDTDAVAAYCDSWPGEGQKIATKARYLAKITGGHMATITYILAAVDRGNRFNSDKDLAVWIQEDPEFPAFIRAYLSGLSGYELDAIQEYAIKKSFPLVVRSSVIWGEFHKLHLVQRYPDGWIGLAIETFREYIRDHWDEIVG